MWSYKASRSLISDTQASGEKRWYIDLKSHLHLLILSHGQICCTIFVTKMPSVVPRPRLKPCCWSSNCSSYQLEEWFSIMITIILNKLDPICRPVYGSVALHFEAPFQRAISLECPHDVGTVWMFQMWDSRFSISVNSLSVASYFKNSAGRSLDALSFFRFNRVDLISSFVEVLYLWFDLL